MKLLREFFEKNDPHFSRGGRMEKYAATYEAVRTVFFHPVEPAEVNPYIRDSLDLKRFMTFVIIAILPVFFFGAYNAGLQANLHGAGTPGFVSNFARGLGILLPLLMVSYGVGFFWEMLFATIRGHNISEGFLVSGLLFPLILPPTTPLWQAALGISFGIVIGKEVFGGTGRNILNPALTARAFLFFSYPAQMSGPNVWIDPGSGVDAISYATPLTMGGSGTHLKTMLTDAGFSIKTLFIGFYPGCIGETSALMCFIGAAFLIITGVASYRIILGGIAGLIVTSTLFMLIPGSEGSWLSAGPLYHLFSGGFAFAVTYMATDPVSGPGTEAGRWVYGILCGFFTVLIRSVNPAFVEGTMLAILFMNIFAPLIDHVVIKINTRKRIPNV